MRDSLLSSNSMCVWMGFSVRVCVARSVGYEVCSGDVWVCVRVRM